MQRKPASYTHNASELRTSTLDNSVLCGHNYIHSVSLRAFLVSLHRNTRSSVSCKWGPGALICTPLSTNALRTPLDHEASIYFNEHSRHYKTTACNDTKCLDSQNASFLSESLRTQTRGTTRQRNVPPPLSG